MIYDFLKFITKYFKKAAPAALSRFQSNVIKKRVPVRVIRPYDLEVDRQRKIKAEMEENSLPHPAEDNN